MLGPLFPNSRLEGHQEEHFDTIIRPPTIAAAPRRFFVSFDVSCFIQRLPIQIVLGESSDHIFEVKIPKTESVSSLKEVIKEKTSRLFKCIDARDLVLWKVSEPIDENLENPPRASYLPSAETIITSQEASKCLLRSAYQRARGTR